MWPDSQETQELMRAAQGKEPVAVNRLLDRHREALVQMIRMRLDRAMAQRVDASDIVQEVLLEASQRLPDYLKEPKLPFHLWLRQMAKDRLIDAHRRHREAQRRSVDREQSLQAAANSDASSRNYLVELRDQELTPAAANIRKEMEIRFLQAIEQLEEEDKEVILMRHYEQLTNSEVAEALGLSQPAAGMRHLRALRRLREILGEDPCLNPMG
ncbi:MAG: sigma-70 family RNA polymerase sigma factor [Planctomycetales bacterium]